MEFFRRNWAQLRAFMDGLTPSQKWLIGAISIILVFTLFFVLQYAAKPQLVPISTYASDRRDEVITRLTSNGIDVDDSQQQLRVSPTQLNEANALLAEHELMANDTSKAFKDLILRQSPWLSPQQNQQAYMLAQQQVLSRIIAKMRGVKSADVMISMPEHKSFGRTMVRPSASVNVVMQGAGGVDRPLVEAVAGLVSGAVAEMRPTDVAVVDALAGRSFTVDSADHVSADRKLADLAKLESYYVSKLRDMLSYIPGVVVAVNVRTDAVVKRTLHKIELEETEPLLSERDKEMVTDSPAVAGAPAARSNTQADIEAGSARGSKSTTSESEKQFGQKQPILSDHSIESGHNTKEINVSVAIPRSYLVNRHKADNPEAENAPDDAALQPMVDLLVKEVENLLAPQVKTDQATSVVQATVVHDSAVTLAAYQAELDAKGVGGMLSGSSATYVSLGVLVLLSLAIMLGMVRRATKSPALPTAEELAGIPPALPEDDEELIGEVAEHDASMTGVEVNDGDLRLQQLADQITSLISENPEESAQLFNRWVRPED